MTTVDPTVITVEQIDAVVNGLLAKGYVSEFEEAGRPSIVRAYKKIGDAAGAQLNIGFAFDLENPHATAQIAKITDDFSKTTTKTAVKDVKKVLTRAMEEGMSTLEAEKLIRDLKKTTWKTRANLIARTEINRASNAGALESYRQSGVVTKKVWIAAADACPYCMSIHGEVISIEANYYDQGELVPAANAPDADGFVNSYSDVGAPPLHPLCLLNHNTPIYTSKGWQPISKINKGDLVLTHKGRFRKVTHVFRHTSQERAWATKITLNNKFKNQNDLGMTSNHPVLTDNGWVPAGDLKTGDKISYMASECTRCGKPIPFYSKYCSQDCYYQDLKKFKNNPMYKKHHSLKTKKLISDANKKNGKFKGSNNPSFGSKKPHLTALNYSRRGIPISEDAKQKQRQSMLNYWQTEEGSKHRQKLSIINTEWAKNNPEKKIEAAKKGNLICPNISSLELKLKEKLNEKSINFISQYVYKLGFVDIFIEPNLCIFVNGDYWHSLEKQIAKDKVQIKFLQEKGNKVLCLWEHEINTDIGKCLEKINIFREFETEAEASRICANHDGQFKFFFAPIKSIKRWQLKKQSWLYNLEVEEDESYVAKGNVVHNCRCAIAAVTEAI